MFRRWSSSQERMGTRRDRRHGVSQWAVGGSCGKLDPDPKPSKTRHDELPLVFSFTCLPLNIVHPIARHVAES